MKVQKHERILQIPKHPFPHLRENTAQDGTSKIYRKHPYGAHAAKVRVMTAVMVAIDQANEMAQNSVSETKGTV